MQYLISALQQYPEPQRRPQEIRNQIADCLETVPFFAEFLLREKVKGNARHVLSNFSNYLHLEKFQAGEYVFHQGDSGDRFYLVLSGVVQVTKHKEEDGSIEEVVIATIREGGCFGELALSFNKPRFATVQCVGQSILCSLSKENYVKIVEYQTRQLLVKTTALKQVFPQLGQNTLIRLGYQMQLHEYPIGCYIVKQNQKPTGFYIISEGDVRLEQMKREHNQIMAPIRVLTPGSIFGVQEVISRKPYTYNAICTTQRVVVYQFSIEAFDQMGDEFGRRTLQGVDVTREPKPRKWRIQDAQRKLVSLRQLTEDSTPRKNFLSSFTTCLDLDEKLAQLQSRRKTFQNVSFRHPFFSDLNAENFKIVKKLNLEKEKQQNLKKYNEQFSVGNYFKPIDLGLMLKPLLAKTDTCNPTEYHTPRTAITPLYPLANSGFNSSRQQKRKH